jgi:hypothetical protein
MSENGTIDSTAVATILGITPNNLRQLVHRKMLMPVGRQKRRSMFNYDDVKTFMELNKKYDKPAE